MFCLIAFPYCHPERCFLRISHVETMTPLFEFLNSFLDRKCSILFGSNLALKQNTNAAKQALPQNTLDKVRIEPT